LFFIIFASSGAKIFQKIENCNFPLFFFLIFNHFLMLFLSFCYHFFKSCFIIFASCGAKMMKMKKKKND